MARKLALFILPLHQLDFLFPTSARFLFRNLFMETLALAINFVQTTVDKSLPKLSENVILSDQQAISQL